jgi:hypothetical protein
MTETHKYVVTVIRGCDFDETFKAANEGIKPAQEFMLAFSAWNKAVTRNEGVPACFSCGEVINPADAIDSNFGGLAVAKPAIDGDDGITGVFCRDCTDRGPTALMNAFAEMMGDMLELELATLH